MINVFYILGPIGLVILVDLLTLRKKFLNTENLLLLLGKCIFTIFLVNTISTTLDFAFCFYNTENTALGNCNLAGIETLVMGTMVLILLSSIASYIFIVFHRQIKKISNNYNSKVGEDEKRN